MPRNKKAPPRNVPIISADRAICQSDSSRLSSYSDHSNFDVLHVRRVVAGNPNTPQQVLTRLANDPFSVIRRHVAHNPRTPKEILRKLAQDSDLDVRLAVAENSQTPPDTLAVLARDESIDVRYDLAENPHMPAEILVSLTKDENPYVRYRALKTLQSHVPENKRSTDFVTQEWYGPESLQANT